MRPVDAVGDLAGLDRIIRPLSAVVRRLPQGVRDLLHGTWFGHPLHPALAQVPVGAWTSAAVLDVVAIGAADPDTRSACERASTLLLGAGLAAAPAAVAAGAVDWSQLRRDQQRIGLVHAAGNATAASLLAASWALRVAGRHRPGRTLGLAGTAIAGTSAAIGGHLAYRWAAGPSHAEETPYVVPGDWHYVGRLEELPDGGLWKKYVDDTPVVVLRQGETVQILAERCGHLGGPLSEGTLLEKDGADCVRCPWHGSTYRFSDGGVVTGPAVAPQPRFDVKVEGGAITARALLPRGVPSA